MTILKELNYLLDKKTKQKLFVLFLMILVASAAELLGVTIILPIVEMAMDQGDFKANKMAAAIIKYCNVSEKEQILLIMIGMTIVVYVVKNIYVCYVYSRQFKFSASVRRDMATKLMTAYLQRPYSFFLKNNSSDLIRNVNVDTGQLFQLIANILSVFSSSLTSICIILYLAYTNFLMTLTIGLILGGCLVVIVFAIQGKNHKNGIISQQINGFLIRHLQQAFEGVKEIKVMNTESRFIELYGEAYKKGTEMEVKYSIYNTMPRYIIETFTVVAVMGFLGINILVNPDYMKLLPQLATFCVAAFKLLPSVNAIYASINTAVYHRASVDLVYRDIRMAEDFSELTDEQDCECDEIEFNDTIQLDDVCFRYEDMEEDVLHHVNLEIRKGQSVGLIGASGGGKTTTADIILSLLKPSSGSVSVDGRDVRDNIRGWRKKLGYIPQFIYLTDDSIRKNVAFGVPEEEIKDELVWKALEYAQLKDFVSELPSGLDTEVGERGTRISGGQRQRIGIARALYRNPEVLVFDEATSALDNETEQEVMRAIEGLQGVKTIIMIAHRLSTIRNCDAVYRVEKGTIIKEK